MKSSKIKIFQKELVTLKPDKRHGGVLLRANDYCTAVENLLSDPSKFRVIYKYPTQPQHA